MSEMFVGAKSFKQVLCGAAWVHSKATTNKDMCEGSSGSISETMCVRTIATTTRAAFAPRHKSELKRAIDTCLELIPRCRCLHGRFARANRRVGRAKSEADVWHVLERK